MPVKTCVCPSLLGRREGGRRAPSGANGRRHPLVAGRLWAWPPNKPSQGRKAWHGCGRLKSEGRKAYVFAGGQKAWLSVSDGVKENISSMKEKENRRGKSLCRNENNGGENIKRNVKACPCLSLSPIPGREKKMQGEETPLTL